MPTIHQTSAVRKPYSGEAVFDAARQNLGSMVDRGKGGIIPQK